MGIVAAVTAIAGVGLSAYSSQAQAGVAKQQAASQQQIVSDEQQQAALQQQAMELDARRKQMDILRNQQRARSMATAAAANQGGLFGSGLQGGFGQISGDANNQQLGVAQSLSLGQSNFGITSDISAQRINLAGLGAQSAYYGALGSLGGSLVTSAGAIGKLGQTDLSRVFGSGPQNFGSIGGTSPSIDGKRIY